MGVGGIHSVGTGIRAQCRGSKESGDGDIPSTFDQTPPLTVGTTGASTAINAVNVCIE
jgi:hypothetical protein